MEKEKYQPSSEEMEKAQEMADAMQNMRGEEMMNDDQKGGSEEREATLEEGYKKGYGEAKKEEAIKLICEEIRDLNIGFRIKKSKGEYNLTDEVFLSPEVQEAAKEKINFFLGYKDIRSALKIKEQFNVPEGATQEGAKHYMIERLSDGYLDDALEIKEGFNLPEEFITSHEVQEAAKNGMIQCLLVSDMASSDAMKIKEEFNVPEEFITSPRVQKAAGESILESLRHPAHIDSVLKRIEQFNVPEGIVQEVAGKAIAYNLSKEHLATAVVIEEKLNVPKDIAREAAKKGIDTLRSKRRKDVNAIGDSDIIDKIKKEYDLGSYQSPRQ